MTCNDNSTEYCGGPNRLNVYKLVGTAVISTTVTTAPGTATTTSPPDESTTPIDTTAAATTTTTTTTSASSSSPTPTGPSVNPGLDGYSSIGCYTEATDARALGNFVATTKETVADCLKACSADGYTYAGLEYGGECWCDNAFAKGSVPAPVEDCSMTCNGNSSEFCGGPNRLNVYQLKKLAVTTTSASAATVPATATSASSTSSTSSIPTPTPTGPAIKKSVGSYVFQGCWEEPPNDRAIIEQMYANDSMTLESCAAFCKGFAYFGTEYGRECYCGNVLKEGSQKATNQDDCSFPCAGDGTEFCGAGSRLELYKTSSNATTTSSVSSATTTLGGITATTAAATVTEATPSASPTGPVIFHGSKNYTYYGCLAEPSAGKLMDQQVYNNDTTMTPQVCLSHCQQYKYAGVEYGQECWCGDTLNLAGWTDATPGKNVSSSECNMVCPGNSTEYCGAGSRLQLYVRKTVVSKRW